METQNVCVHVRVCAFIHICVCVILSYDTYYNHALFAIQSFCSFISYFQAQTISFLCKLFFILENVTDGLRYLLHTHMIKYTILFFTIIKCNIPRDLYYSDLNLTLVNIKLEYNITTVFQLTKVCSTHICDIH